MDTNTNFNLKESLLELCQYLEDNAEKLVQEERIKIKPYSRRKRYAGINWTVVEIEDLGRVHMMFTNGNSTLNVNLIQKQPKLMISKFKSLEHFLTKKNNS